MSRFESTPENSSSLFEHEQESDLVFGLTPYQAMVAIVLVSFVLRAVCAIWFRGMVDGEGAEYGRIAQNLLAGVGYVGIATEGQQLFFPPLFPWLIAAVASVTGDAEVAGRAISVVAGSLVVIPVYLIARRLYGGRIAIFAAALTGVHPFLVQFSSTVFCEPTYLTIVLVAIYMAMRAIDHPTPRNLFAMGALYGLAYLVRQEAMAYALIGSAFVGLQIWLQGQRRVARFAGLSLVALGFLLFAAPYIGWLSVQSGHFRLQGKSPLNIPTESRIQQGQSSEEAAFAVAPDLTPTGTWMRPSLTSIQAYKIGAGDLAKLLLKRAKDVLDDASATIAGGLEFGSPFLFALAILGLFAYPWTLRLLIAHAHILAILGLVPVGLLFTYVVGPRFYILYLPFLCMWAVLGIFKFSQWAKQSAALCGLAQAHLPKIVAGAQIFAALSILLPAATFAVKRLQDSDAERAFKEAMVNLSATQRAPMRIADTSTPAAFHAHADFVWLPYSDEATALRFLEKSGVTHVVLRDNRGDRPYLKKWIDQGVPGARQLVDVTSATGARFKIYQLGQ